MQKFYFSFLSVTKDIFILQVTFKILFQFNTSYLMENVIIHLSATRLVPVCTWVYVDACK